MPQSRVIKKYPNRRLYDTEISSYVTLEDVRQLIVDGEEFEVRDARTGADLTRSVLLQILAEHEDIGQPIFSTQLLTTVIRFYGDSLQGIIGSYLERSIQVFSEQQQQLRGTLGNLVVQTPWNLLNQLADKNMEIWKGVQQGIKSGLAAGSESPRMRRARRRRARRRPSPAEVSPAETRARQAYNSLNHAEARRRGSPWPLHRQAPGRTRLFQRVAQEAPRTGAPWGNRGHPGPSPSAGSALVAFVPAIQRPLGGRCPPCRACTNRSAAKLRTGAGSPEASR
jgi:polyhydroxyalkanoate synthesis repressor PhaR